MRLFLIILLSFICLPAFAVKDLDKTLWGKPEKVEVLLVEHALEVKIDYNRMRAPAYVRNLDCHEFSRQYSLNDSQGNIYLRPRSRTVKENSLATELITKIFEKNSNNVYFVPSGYGLFGNLVGEFFIGEQSLSKYLIDNGYCSFVKNNS